MRHLTSHIVVPAKAGTQSLPLARTEGAGPPNMDDKRPCVYILASRRNGTLYVGVTSDVARRVSEHRLGAVEGFTRDYGVHTLVFAEFHETMEDAIVREKRTRDGGVPGNWN